MELLAVAGLFVGLALLAAIPLVVLLHMTQRDTSTPPRE
jgi:hypothetical protein